MLVFQSRVKGEERNPANDFSLIVSHLSVGLWRVDVRNMAPLLLRSVRLDFGLSVLFVVGFLGQGSGHGCRLHHGFEATLPLLDVLLRVKDDDVDFGDVEHSQGHGGAQAHGHRQSGGLDEHLQHTRLVRKIPHTHSLCHLIDCHNSVFTIFISKHSRQCSSPDESLMTWYM